MTMTTQEHLQRIKATCQHLLAQAEKRTPGKWNNRHHRAEVLSQHDDLVACCDDLLSTPDDVFHACINGDFIASCAGPAEAGWRATIAAIDGLEKCHVALPDGDDTAWNGLNAILSAWPEELLLETEVAKYEVNRGPLKNHWGNDEREASGGGGAEQAGRLAFDDREGS